MYHPGYPFWSTYLDPFQGCIYGVYQWRIGLGIPPDAPLTHQDVVMVTHRADPYSNTSKRMQMGYLKSMILDPFFMVLVVLHILLQHGKTMFAKNVYRHFQNVPLPCHCP